MANRRGRKDEPDYSDFSDDNDDTNQTSQSVVNHNLQDQLERKFSATTMQGLANQVRTGHENVVHQKSKVTINESDRQNAGDMSHTSTPHSSTLVNRLGDSGTNWDLNANVNRTTVHPSKKPAVVQRVNIKERLAMFNNPRNPTYRPKKVVIPRGEAHVVENTPQESGIISQNTPGRVAMTRFAENTPKQSHLPGYQQGRSANAAPGDQTVENNPVQSGLISEKSAPRVAMTRVSENSPQQSHIPSYQHGRQTNIKPRQPLGQSGALLNSIVQKKASSFQPPSLGRISENSVPAPPPKNNLGRISEKKEPVNDASDEDNIGIPDPNPARFTTRQIAPQEDQRFTQASYMDTQQIHAAQGGERLTNSIAPPDDTGRQTQYVGESDRFTQQSYMSFDQNRSTTGPGASEQRFTQDSYMDTHQISEAQSDDRLTHNVPPPNDTGRQTIEPVAPAYDGGRLTQSIAPPDDFARQTRQAEEDGRFTQQSYMSFDQNRDTSAPTQPPTGQMYMEFNDNQGLDDQGEAGIGSSRVSRLTQNRTSRMTNNQSNFLENQQTTAPLSTGSSIQRVTHETGDLRESTEQIPNIYDDVYNGSAASYTAADGICAKAIYDYEGEEEDELTINPGEIITNIEVVDEGWWIGDLNGQRGMFPSNYVEKIN